MSAFAHLEARTNRQVMEKLANATAVIDGAPVPVIFDAEYRAGSVGIGMGAAAPQLVIAAERVPAEFVGKIITVNGASWVVADSQPDSELPAGLCAVVLEKA